MFYITNHPSFLRNLDLTNTSLFQMYPIFLLGSLIAYVYRRLDMYDINQKIKHFPLIDTCICVLTFFLQIFGIRVFYLFEMEWTEKFFFWNSAIWAFLLFMMLIGSPNEFSKWMDAALLCKNYGKYSFGTYLFHVLPLRWISKQPWLDNLFIEDKIIIAISFALIIGYLFHRFIEKPSLNLGQRINSILFPLKSII